MTVGRRPDMMEGAAVWRRKLRGWRKDFMEWDCIGSSSRVKS